MSSDDYDWDDEVPLDYSDDQPPPPPPEGESKLWQLLGMPVYYRESGQAVSLGQGILLAAACVVAFYLLRGLLRLALQYRNSKLAEEVLRQRNERPYHFDTSRLDVEAIIKMDTTQLRQGQIDKQFTAVDLVNVFASRCLEFGRTLNLSAEENFKQALNLARERDLELEKALAEGREVGALHGIPISVKDFINQAGKLSTFGVSYLSKTLITKDAIVLQQYVEAGAIPLVKGNVPQFAASIHTINKVWGEAISPLNPERSPGGSSGGDAGLVASRSVPLAIGNDSGGSNRFPALFCGVCSFKPTTGRVSSEGTGSVRLSRFDEFTYLPPVPGPIAKTVGDLVSCTKIQLDENITQKTVLQTPSIWNEDQFQLVQENPAEVKIGILQESPFLPLSDSTKRAIKITERALRELGYQVVPFFLTEEVWTQGRDMMNAIIANGFLEGVVLDMDREPESLLPAASMAKMLFTMPRLLRAGLNFSMKHLLGRGRAAKSLRNFRKMSDSEFEKVLAFREQFLYTVSEKWQKANLAALVSPIYPHCAFKREHALELGGLNEYTFIWSLLGYPSGVLPVTKVEAAEQQFRDHYEDRWTYLLNESARGSAGLPIGLQLIGHPQEDEKILGVMTKLEEKLEFSLEAERMSAQSLRSVAKSKAASRKSEKSRKSQAQSLKAEAEMTGYAPQVDEEGN